MKNKKGQALVEFVLILPVLIFIILAFIDISRLMIMKNHLESMLSEVDKDTIELEDKEYQIQISKKNDGDKVQVELKSCLEVTTPGLNKIFGSPACVTTSKIIENKEE